MTILFRASVIGIFLSLGTWLYLVHLHPRMEMRAARLDLRYLAAACDQATRAAEIELSTKDQLPRPKAVLLHHAQDTSRLPCGNYAELRERLLSKGVSQHALTAEHLSATKDPAYPSLTERRETDAELDRQLRVAIEAHSLTPLALKNYVRDPKFLLGEKLFNDPLLSGYTERTCATCHRAEASTADTAQLEPQLDVSPAWLPQIPARNVPDLWNRDHNDVATMLWDGRLEVTISADLGGLSSPEGLDTIGFENLMALQSVRPVFKPTEMLGEPGHQNALAPNGNTPIDPNVVLARLAERLFDEQSGGEQEQDYRALFRASYGISHADQIAPAHLGNAIAHYIEIEFQTRDTPWDKYLMGNTSALSPEQKQGAIIFYGIGRCAVCHSGSLFSDFAFHSIGVPDPRPHKDLGRFYATGNDLDRFLFRTPSLRNSTLTGPYFHNGEAATLKDAITQHLDPYRFSRAYAETGEHLMGPEEISAISPILLSSKVVTPHQTELIVEFLKTLEDRRDNASQ